MAAELPSWIPARLMSVNETAELLHLSPRHVRRMIAEGRLAAIHIDGAVRIAPETIARKIARD